MVLMSEEFWRDRAGIFVLAEMPAHAELAELRAEQAAKARERDVEDERRMSLRRTYYV